MTAGALPKPPSSPADRRRILVTGGSGFIGKRVLRLLRDPGDEVHAVGRRVPSEPASGVAWHEADLRDAGAAQALVHKVRPTHLLHLAWEATPGKYLASEENLQWREATRAMADAFGETGGRRFVGAGSCFEYDLAGLQSPLTERSPARPTTLYGQCKLAACHGVQSSAARLGFQMAWGRIFYLYGPGEDRRRLVPSVADALREGREARCTAGTQFRDYLHVDDVARALVVLLDAPVEGPVNVCSGEPVAVRDVVLAISRLAGRPDLVRLGALPTPATDPPYVVGDCGKLKGGSSWRPIHTLTAGLANAMGTATSARP